MDSIALLCFSLGGKSAKEPVNQLKSREIIPGLWALCKEFPRGEFAGSLSLQNVPKGPCSKDGVELSQLYLTVSFAELCRFCQLLSWFPTL